MSGGVLRAYCISGGVLRPSSISGGVLRTSSISGGVLRTSLNILKRKCLHYVTRLWGLISNKCITHILQTFVHGQHFLCHLSVFPTNIVIIVMGYFQCRNNSIPV